MIFIVVLYYIGVQSKDSKDDIVIHTLPFNENPTSSLMWDFLHLLRNVDFLAFLRSKIITVLRKWLQYMQSISCILETRYNFYAIFPYKKAIRKFNFLFFFTNHFILLAISTLLVHIFPIRNTKLEQIRYFFLSFHSPLPSKNIDTSVFLISCVPIPTFCTDISSSSI